MIENIAFVDRDRTLPGQRQTGQFASALSHANMLHELEPADQQVDQLLPNIR